MLDANLRESDSIQCILNEIRFPWQVFFKTTNNFFYATMRNFPGRDTGERYFDDHFCLVHRASI